MSITVALAWIPTAIQRNFMNWQMRIESAWTRSPLQRKMEKEQAEQVLEDLGIDGMGLVDSDRTVWSRMAHVQSAMVWDLVVMLCGREIWIEDYRDICYCFRKV